MTADHISILLVDDSASILFMLDKILRPMFATRKAANGREALQAMDQGFAPDIIVLDLSMPVMNGLEVIEAVRSRKQSEDVYILVLTANDDAKLKAEALNNGANDFLVKPFHRNELTARVGVAERQVRLTRQLRKAHRELAREIDLVAGLQRHMLPAPGDFFGCCKVDAVYIPSKRASGDFYDFFPIGHKRLRVMAADVSGHGARAAFLVGVVHTLLHSTRSLAMPLDEVLGLINDHLLGITAQDGDFVTVFAADLDLAGGTMEYVNAGHPAALLMDGKGNTAKLPASTPLLGLLEVVPHRLVLDLPKEFGLFLYTDGLYEWPDSDGELFGETRLLDMVQKQADFTHPFLGKLVDELTRRSRDAAGSRDDLTAVWVQGSRS